MKHFVKTGVWQHVYRITRDAGVLFYRTEDRLFYFTLFCTLVRKHGIRAIGLCLMFTHTHEMLEAESNRQLIDFERELSSTANRILNIEYGLSEGSRISKIFRTPFGCASKSTLKSKRSSYIYLLNNPVEKHLVSHAIEDRWNFMAYQLSPNPFSDKLIKRRSSYAMRMACRRVDYERKAGKYLRPTFIIDLMSKLDDREKEQLTDYIINKYNALDYLEGSRLFGTFEKLRLAADSTTGSEYDIGEEFEISSDACYSEMLKICESRNLLSKDMRLLHLSKEERKSLIRELRRKTGATNRQLQKLFHLPT